ncbi:hypothetical protein BHM03_00039370, partial [Ensete ventricosum]
GRPLWALRWQPSLRAGRPLQAVAPAGGSPLQVAGSPLTRGPWLQPAAPTGGGLVVASRPLARGLDRSRLPLTASHDQPLLLAVLAVNALNDST